MWDGGDDVEGKEEDRELFSEGEGVKFVRLNYPRLPRWESKRSNSSTEAKRKKIESSARALKVAKQINSDPYPLLIP